MRSQLDWLQMFMNRLYQRFSLKLNVIMFKIMCYCYTFLNIKFSQTHVMTTLPTVHLTSNGSMILRRQTSSNQRLMISPSTDSAETNDSKSSKAQSLISNLLKNLLISTMRWTKCQVLESTELSNEALAKVNMINHNLELDIVGFA